MLDPLGTILEVQNRSRWVGSARLGEFVIYLDGQRAAVVPLGESCRISTAPGNRILRARRWWYASDPIPLTLTEGSITYAFVDVSKRDESFLGRLMRYTFRPFHSLYLEILK